MNKFDKYYKLFGMSQGRLKSYLAQRLRSAGRYVDRADGYLYSPGTLPVMLIAHMDTVHKNPVETLCISGNGSILMSPEGIGGDDRCGVIMILELIKQYDCHVLFCEDEEIGSVGARKFIKDYDNSFPELNYMVEIDRRGENDCVFYDCDNVDFVKFVEQFGFKEEWGTFSDISVIAPEMGVAAVNISAGYFNEHNKHEHINLDIVETNIGKIGKMIGTNGGKFEYIPCKWYSKYNGKSYGYDSYYNYGSYGTFNSGYWKTHEYSSDKNDNKEDDDQESAVSRLSLCDEYAMGEEMLLPFFGRMHKCERDSNENCLKYSTYVPSATEIPFADMFGNVYMENDFGVHILKPELSAYIEDVNEMDWDQAIVYEWYTQAAFEQIIFN